MSLNSPRWVKRFEISVSILTALVTMLSAVVAWRAAIAGDAAGNADFSGLAASINQQESVTLNSSKTYQQYRAFTSYFRNNELGNALANDLSSASSDERRIMERDRALSLNQTIVDQYFFETRYLNPDGTYAVQRQLSEAEAEDAQRKDIDPEPHFTEADRLRVKSNLMVGLLIIMAGSLWFYTMASEIKHAIRYPLALIGLLCMMVGLIGTFIIEVL
ncbi:MAG: hypothetical protein SH847_21240 [Roseiflexaceae bacterium]|nr:hypothetical protein [Roseiflexaceae bacterium]